MDSRTSSSTAAATVVVPSESGDNRTMYKDLLPQQHSTPSHPPVVTQSKVNPKFDTNTHFQKMVTDGESSNRQLLPVIVCLISFATVLSVLIIYMDTTEIRHQQFRMNMSRDTNMLGVSQDNPTLVTYVREVFMRRYVDTPHFASKHASEDETAWDFRRRTELTPRMARFVVDYLLGGKRRGVFVQSMPGESETQMTAPWLVLGGADWEGVIVEPEPRRYFDYRRQNAHRPGVDVVHACVSPHEYPKEVTLRGRDAEDEAESDVKINSVFGGEEDAEAWFHSRVKCFPLYTIMLATNRTKVDLLSLGCQGQHLQVRKGGNWELLEGFY